MSIVRHKFGPDGVAYLREYLTSNEEFGKRFGAFLKARELESGTTTAFVPSQSSSQQRTDFRNGGLFSKAGDDKSSGTRALQSWIRDVLASPGLPPHLLCVEDSLRQRTDSMPETSSDRTLFFCGSDVYWYTREPEAAPDILRPSATWTPDIAILTPLPIGSSKIHNGESVDPEVLRRMTNAAIGVVVGAWDAEGWLIWESADAASLSPRSRLFTETRV